MASAANWIRSSVLGTDSEPKLWIVGILALLLVQFLVKKHFSGSDLEKKIRLPPGPLNLPLVGAMFSMESNHAHGFTKLSRKFGPIIYCRMGSHNVVIVSSVDGAKEVLNTKDSQFADRPDTTIMKTGAKYLSFGSLDIAMAGYNNNVKMLKSMCINDFFTTSKLATYQNVRRYEGASMVEEILSHRKEGSSAGSKIINANVRDSLNITATNVMCTLLFGKRFSNAMLSDSDKFVDYPVLIQRQIDLAIKFNFVDFFPWIEWLVPNGLLVSDQYKVFAQYCRDSLGPTLEEHRQVRTSVENYQDRDFVDHLLTLYENGKIAEDTIFGCMMDMMAAGIDTNTTTTEWALLELVKHPGVLTKLQKEIDEIVGSDRPVEESDFASLKYLQAVIKETFRLHHPLPILVPHFTKTAASLGGFDIPANTAVFVNTYGISRDPLLWDHPEEFDPERFMGSKHSDIANLTTGTYQLLAFGRGRRMCPGYSMGQLLVQRTLATLVHAFDWSPPPGVGVDDISREEETGIMTRPKTPLVLSAVPRLAPTVYSTRGMSKSV